MDNGLDITRVDYKSGYCIFGFDTSPTLCHGEPQERKRNGTLRTNIAFRTPLPNSINVIMYMEFDNNTFVDKTRHITNHLRCIFCKDPYTRGIFEGVFAKNQFIKEHFERKKYLHVRSESHWVMVYQNKKKTYFIDSLGRDFTHYNFKFKRPVYQVSRR